MKNALPFVLMVFGITAYAKGELGPLAVANNVVYSSGYAQFEKTMETGLAELGQGRFIRLLYEQGLQVNKIPVGVTPEAVTVNRYDRILNPKLKTSLLRVIGDATVKRTLNEVPRRLPYYPMVTSVFVAMATDTYNLNKANRLRTIILDLQTPVDITE